MMKSKIILILFVFFPFHAWATNYYEVIAGGEITPCGTVSAGDVVSSNYCVGMKTPWCASVEYTGLSGKQKYLTPMRSGGNSCGQSWVKAIQVNGCPENYTLNDEGICKPKPQEPDCSATKDQSVDRQWNPVSFGSRPSYCYESCLYTTTESVCIETDGTHSCSGTVQGTGETCDADGVIPGGTFPDKNPDPGDGGDTGGDNSGGGDTGGGNTGGDNSGGDGDTGGFDDSGILSKLDSMQIDSNAKLDTLAAKLDELSGQNDSQTKALEAAIKANGESTKQGLDGVQGKLDNLAASIDGVSTGVNDVVDSVNQLSDKLTNVDTSQIGQGGCWETDSCMRLYQPAYENGIGGILMKHYEQLKQQVTSGMMDKFNTLDISNASKPSYVIDLNFGAFGNYGRHDIFQVAGLGNIFLFIRIVLMASTILYARSLVFGG